MSQPLSAFHAYVGNRISDSSCRRGEARAESEAVKRSRTTEWFIRHSRPAPNAEELRGRYRRQRVDGPAVSHCSPVLQVWESRSISRDEREGLRRDWLSPPPR